MRKTSSTTHIADDLTSLFGGSHAAHENVYS